MIDNINIDEDDLQGYVFRIYPGLEEIQEYLGRFYCLYFIFEEYQSYSVIGSVSDSDSDIGSDSDSD